MGWPSVDNRADHEVHVTSAAEAETAALFLTVKEMVALRNTLEEMERKQPPSPLQCDNSTPVGYRVRMYVFFLK